MPRRSPNTAGNPSVRFYTSLSSGALRNVPRSVPKFVIVPIEASPPDLLAVLRPRRVDAALTVDEVFAPDLAMLRLWDEPLPAVLPDNSPLADQESVTRADLAAEPLGVRTLERAPVLSMSFAGIFASPAPNPEVAPHGFSPEALSSVVEIGFGATVVGASATRPTYPDLAFRSIAGPDASSPAIVLDLPDHGNPVRQKFDAVLRDRTRAGARRRHRRLAT